MLKKSLIWAFRLSTALSDGRLMALNPEMSPLKTLFENKRASILMNVGPLVVPTSRISTCAAKALTLMNGVVLPIGKTYLKETKQVFK